MANVRLHDPVDPHAELRRKVADACDRLAWMAEGAVLIPDMLRRQLDTVAALTGRLVAAQEAELERLRAADRLAAAARDHGTPLER